MREARGVRDELLPFCRIENLYGPFERYPPPGKDLSLSPWPRPGQTKYLLPNIVLASSLPILRASSDLIMPVFTKVAMLGNLLESRDEFLRIQRTYARRRYLMMVLLIIRALTLSAPGALAKWPDSSSVFLLRYKSSHPSSSPFR